MTVSEKLAYLASERLEEQEMLLAQALAHGVEVLYREARIAAYLAGRASREETLRELGPEIVVEVESQRDALERDVEWGLRD